MKIRLVTVLCVVAAASLAMAQGPVFFDGFESGGLCGWMDAYPTPACYAETNVLLPGFVNMTFIQIPAGTFTIGSSEQGSDTDEDVHQVTLSSNYLMGKTEVTQQQWSAMGFVNPSLYWSADGSSPVETVNYYEAARYANAVSISEGLTECYSLQNCTGDPGEGMVCDYIGTLLSCTGYRLPTEAKWERAARSLTRTRFSHGNVLECGDQCESCPLHDQYMLYCGSGATTTGPAGARLPNAFGLDDMHGSVWEFAQDWYQASLGTLPVVDPTGPGTGSTRAIRGGAMLYSADRCRSAERDDVPMNARGGDIGFRLERSLE